MNEFFGGINSQGIVKYLMATLLLLSAFLVVEVLQGLKNFGYIGKDVYPQRTITAYGDGESFAIPDVASFSFSVLELGKTVTEAQEKVDSKINRAVTVLKEGGIEEKDIKTTNYNFYPKYEWEQPLCLETSYPRCPSAKNVLVGYEVNQTITVKIRDTEKVGDLVTKIGTIGASSVSGVEFTVDKREKYEAMAREEAIKEAKENAKTLAKNLGVKLGKMFYFSENGNRGARYDTGDVENKDIMPYFSSNKTELPIGESKIISNVSIIYEIR